MSLTSELRRGVSVAIAFVWPSRAEDRSIPALDGGLAPNDHVDAGDVLWQSTTAEPDDIVAADDGTVVVSVGADVLRVDPRTRASEVVAALPGRVGALATDAEGVLALVDGVGVFRLPPGGPATRVCEAPIACATAMTVAGGVAYVAVGSDRFPAEQWDHDLMTKGRTGRVVRVDLATGRTETVAGGLAWPGGVVADGDGLLVTEAWRHRLLRIDPVGGSVTPVRANLPGYPMRITADGAGGYLLAFVALRTHLIDLVLREDDYREEMVRSVPPRFWIAPALRSEGERWEPLQIGSMKHLNQTKPWAPSRSYGLLAGMTADGTLTRSWHARTGSRRTGVVAAVRVDGRVVLVAKGGRMVVAVDEEAR